MFPFRNRIARIQTNTSGFNQRDTPSSSFRQSVINRCAQSVETEGREGERETERETYLVLIKFVITRCAQREERGGRERGLDVLL